MSKQLSPYARRAAVALREGKALIPYRGGDVVVYKQAAKDRAGYFSQLKNAEMFMPSVINELLEAGIAERDQRGNIVEKKS